MNLHHISCVNLYFWQQLLALANGDRIKDKQRSRNSFIVDIDKKLAAEKLLEELLAYHGPIITQVTSCVIWFHVSNFLESNP